MLGFELSLALAFAYIARKAEIQVIIFIFPEFNQKYCLLLPVYPAIALLTNHLHGGTSRPWGVTVLTEKGPETYVLKLFSQKDTDQLPYLNKEMFASVIAQELDIPVPEPALIKITKDFIDSLTREEDQKRLQSFNQSIFFGCKYYKGYSILGAGLDQKRFANIHQETVFAFDVLIRNFDRRKDKPNLIISGTDCRCIDHDRSLDIQKTFSEYLAADLWAMFSVQGENAHLFHKFLKKKNQGLTGGKVDFMEFKEVFRSFHTRNLDKAVETLHENGIFTDDYYLIKEYLQEVIGNKTAFYKLLNLLIS